MGFKGLVWIGPTTLDDRDFLCWLMDRFDPETMMLHIGGGKVLVVSEHAIHCVLLLPRDGGDPPHTSDESAKLARTNVVARLFPDNPNPSAVKINPIEVAKLMEKFHTEGVGDFDDDFCLRLFFIVANCSFLTPNTDSYIRIVDAKWCEDLSAISGFIWCKIVFDNLRDAGRKWQLSRKLNKERPSILGCAMFLIIDNGLDPFTTPRCMLYTKEIIKSMQHADQRKNGSGATLFGNAKLKIISSTCYHQPPAPAVGQAPVPPPPPIHHANLPPSGLGTNQQEQHHLYSSYPSMQDTFAGVIAEFLSEGQKEEVDAAMKNFDDATLRAQQLTREANDVMLNAHKECFLAMHKIMDQIRAENANREELRSEMPQGPFTVHRGTPSSGGDQGHGEHDVGGGGWISSDDQDVQQPEGSDHQEQGHIADSPSFSHSQSPPCS